jgi:pimeloyl-ACP methyl ester carboxylesterase
MASADLNWGGAYGDLVAAGYRVLAPDHRGHGRGMRAVERFRLSDCAADAAGLLRELDAAPAIVVGYSMGGAVAQLLARDHGELVSGLVLSGTKMEFSSPREMRTWRVMAGLRALLQIAPYETWRRGLARVGIRKPEHAAWVGSELLRHSARDVAEAGRELGRFDSRAWVGALAAPVAVVVTTKDRDVTPRKQRELAAAAGATVFEAPVTHVGLVAARHDYNPVLLQAIEAVAPGSRQPARAA